jgi:hypothetical protein
MLLAWSDWLMISSKSASVTPYADNRGMSKACTNPRTHSTKPVESGRSEDGLGKLGELVTGGVVLGGERGDVCLHHRREQDGTDCAVWRGEHPPQHASKPVHRAQFAIREDDAPDQATECHITACVFILTMRIGLAD